MIANSEIKKLVWNVRTISELIHQRKLNGGMNQKLVGVSNDLTKILSVVVSIALLLNMPFQVDHPPR